MILACIGVIIIICLFIIVLNSTDIPKIKGLAEAPGWPIFGSLFELGENHALALSKMAKSLGPVFQVRMGNKRIIAANSFDSIRELWIRNQSALISRPLLHTFHTVVSSSQGFTIGTSPWDESCKRRRKVAATALNKPAVQSYMPIIDVESYSSINDILNDCDGGRTDIDIVPHLYRFALNTSLMLNYGTRFDSSDDELLKEIVDVEAAISRFRSTSNNWQDYVPLLRIFPSRSNEANSYRLRRDYYLDILLNGLKKNIANGTDKPCITGNVLKDPSEKLNEAEIKSICLTMVSAGLDTVPRNIIFGIGYLSSPHGQEIQERAYQEIQDAYPDGDAWEKCLVEERVPYVSALYKEILRYFTVIRICLPRRSISDIDYNGATIPAGTLFYMNAFAGDYDEHHFTDPYTFNPERYLGDVDGTPHFAYGAGSRMCAGAHLANRELFTFFIRLISAFRILPPKDQNNAAKSNAMEAILHPTALVVEPKPFKCRFEPRNREMLKSWLEESKTRANDYSY
jgi:phenylacetate 2-hydroxylase